jgi:hypothetical protein
VVGILNGFAILVEPGDDPDGGLVTVSPRLAEILDPSASSVLGQSSRIDPFHMRQLEPVQVAGYRNNSSPGTIIY